MAISPQPMINDACPSDNESYRALTHQNSIGFVLLFFVLLPSHATFIGFSFLILACLVSGKNAARAALLS